MKHLKYAVLLGTTAIAVVAQVTITTKSLSVGSVGQPYSTPLAATSTPPPTKQGWYVSTSGTSGGAGTQASPWDLETALRGAGGRIKPGDTVWVRGGTYYGRFASTLSGTAQQPIVVRAYPGERATIDGKFETPVTAAVPSGAPGTNVTIPIADGSGFAGNIPNAHMSVRLEYTPPGSTKMQEETLLVLSVGPQSLSARWPSTCRSGSTCISFPLGTTAVATDVEYLRASGSYTWFWGLEVMYTQGGHVFAAPWPNFQGAVSDRCTGCKFINMVIHDSGGNGIFSGGTGRATEIYGNLIYYNGADNLSGRAHGHGIYTQNVLNGPTKTIEDNVIFRSFYHGSQVYGTSAANLDNYHVEGNTYFNAAEPSHHGTTVTQFLIGDAGVFRNHVFKDNMLYGSGGLGADIGYGGNLSAPECMSPVITGNYLVNKGASSLKVTCNTPTITGNTLFGSVRDFSPSAYPSNTYLSSLSGQKIFVRPNKYEAGRANVTIFNWSGATTASVNVSGIGLANGDRYEVRDVQNFFGAPVASGTYSGVPITVPLNNTAVTQPIGIIAVPPIKHTLPEFNAFVVIRN